MYVVSTKKCIIFARLMPIIYRKNIKNHGVLGVWKITESVDDMLSMIQFTDEDHLTFEKFKIKSRQAHWLAYRLAARQLLDPDEECSFFYDDNGKLHFANLNYQISVTHSGVYAGVIISKNRYVGLDIEKLGDRIEHLAEKFLMKEELKNLPAENQQRYLTVLWSAKEALYKLFGKPKVQFDRDIFLSPFELKRKGEFEGRISNYGVVRDYVLEYEFSDDDEYVLVHCADENIEAKPKTAK